MNDTNELAETVMRIAKDDRQAHPNFHLHASSYAAKLAADTILTEHPTRPDLSDLGILTALAVCGRPVYPSEVSMVRDAYISEYGEL